MSGLGLNIETYFSLRVGELNFTTANQYTTYCFKFHLGLMIVVYVLVSSDLYL